MELFFELKRIIKFFYYKLFAKHRKGYGIHSPFVYDLIIKVFNIKGNKKIFEKIELTRKQLIKTNKKVILNSFGAGSKILNKQVKVKHLVKVVSIPEKYGILLFNFIQYFKSITIIELGTSIGISTLYLAYAANAKEVYSIEGDENLIKMASKNFKTHNLTNINLIKGKFEDYLPRILQKFSSKLFIFIDGDHRDSPLLNYLNEIYKYINNDTIIVIDDIHLNRSMEKVWNIIKYNKKVSVTIDIFRMGIIFFKSDLQKQDFIIKY